MKFVSQCSQNENEKWKMELVAVNHLDLRREGRETWPAYVQQA
jgi:hypothetical protein